VVILVSSAFGSDTSIPRHFTCEGDDVSPPLAWREAPARTQSFVIVCDDPDAPAGTWHHWCVYDIPADWNGLPQGIQAGSKGLRLAVNDSGKVGYSGPCPPRGHGQHHYQFQLLALSVDALPPMTRPSCQEVQREARKHAIAEASLVGTYKRI
jgi:Raf kinase inhibitor-like YbhB/YbcL family protein